MDLMALRYFVAVAENKSFTRAAELLFTTQPTLSRQISSLETEFGTQLFIRETHGVSLTKEGQFLLKEAREIINHCNRITSVLSSQNLEMEGQLSIGYQGFLDNYVMFEALADIRSQYASMKVVMRRFNVCSELNNVLINKGCDVVFTLYDSLAMAHNSSIQFFKVEKDPLCLAVPENHPLSSKTSVKIAELAQETFIMLERDASPFVVDSTNAMCFKNGFSPRVEQYVRDAQTLLIYVSAGNGIAFLCEKVQHIPDDVKLLTIEDCDIDFDIVMAYRKDNENAAIPAMEAAVKRHIIDTWS